MKLSLNLNAWKDKTKKAKAKVEGKASVYVQRKVSAVLNSALKASPQWSGNYAYNWRIEITGYTGGGWMRRFYNEDWRSNTAPKQQGDMEAIKANRLNNDEIISQIKWNSVIRLVNYAPVAAIIEDPSSRLISDGAMIRLRPENPALQNATMDAYLRVKYTFLRKQ